MKARKPVALLRQHCCLNFSGNEQALKLSVLRALKTVPSFRVLRKLTISRTPLTNQYSNLQRHEHVLETLKQYSSVKQASARECLVRNISQILDDQSCASYRVDFVVENSHRSSTLKIKKTDNSKHH